MTKLMAYAARFANVPRAIDVLRHHPEGLSVDQLAAEIAVHPARLREELTTFYVADVVDSSVGIRLASIEFVGSDGDVSDAVGAVRVRLAGTGPLSELGVELLDVSQLARLYRGAWELSTLEPDNAVLARTVQRLGATLVPTADDRPDPGAVVAGRLRLAIQQRRRVELVYSRTWQPGVTTRVIEPYRLVSSRRGYEVDAAALDRQGELRTFLVSGIRQVRVLDDTFVRPSDVDRRIADNRRTTEVTFVVPVDRAWVIERLSETVEVGRGDADDVEVVAHVVAPVAERVGLMVAIAGPGTFVASPRHLVDAGEQAARRLLTHHGLDGPSVSDVVS